MTTARTKTAACMCGAVQFEIDVSEHAQSAPAPVTSCHCKMCRNWTGGIGFMAVTLPRDQIKYLLGEDKIRLFNSSSWGRRAFCTDCGTSLFWQLKDSKMIQVAAGLFDDSGWLKHRHQIFVDHNAPWHALSHQCTATTEAEILASLKQGPIS